MAQVPSTDTDAQDGSSRASTGSAGIMQGFSLPGESAKAAKILKHFLGEYIAPLTGFMLRQREGGREQGGRRPGCRVER
jgi:hypothetical protein